MMKATSRPRDIGLPFTASSRERAAQLNIGNSKHHITEAIGEIYGDEDYLTCDPRLLSSTKSPVLGAAGDKEPILRPRVFSWAPALDNVNESTLVYLKSPTTPDSTNTNSLGAKMLSPSSSSQDDASTPQNPIGDIRYETDPAEFAQALSNLQALRRMSIDIGSTSDPDLPLFQGAPFMPSIAPTGDDNDDDPSRLFWVPARVHPELAPMEFKTFLENRVQSIKRQNGEQVSISLDRLDRDTSQNSLGRKKSLLSSQLDNSGGVSSDKSGRLETGGSPLSPNLQSMHSSELRTLVKNHSEVLRKLTQEGKQNGFKDTNGLEDIPILPQAPGVGLRRSTRTTYRRGSLRTMERVTISKRAGSRNNDNGSEKSTSLVQESSSSLPSEPSSTENFSHTTRTAQILQGQPVQCDETSHTKITEEDESSPSVRKGYLPPPSNSMSKVPLVGNIGGPDPRPDSPHRSKTIPFDRNTVTQIKEAPSPTDTHADQVSMRQPVLLPERSSSQSLTSAQKNPNVAEVNSSSNINVTNSIPQIVPTNVTAPRQKFNGTSQSASQTRGNNFRTEALTYIPTLETKKSDKKSKRDKEDSDNHVSRKTTTWNWFKGTDEKEKKEKRKEDDRDSKKYKKLVMEKNHDNARLDVLQSTLDNASTNGRESILLDRDSLDSRVLDEKRKDSRKINGEKKEKEGIFSSIFGGVKRRNDRDGNGKKCSSLRTISPEILPRYLKPDVDYNWTRFSILEERAIYRMAHLKLANPRRALYSQVLLSNFMYSYLAKVQQMHPHLQIPQSALQKKQETERQQKEQEQQAMHQLLETDQYNYDYHEGISKYAETGQIGDNVSKRVNYVDDSQIYDMEHRQENNSMYGQGPNRPYSRASQHSSEAGVEFENQYGRQDNEYYQHQDQQRTRDEDEMW